jgi:hypothetical protein
MWWSDYLAIWMLFGPLIIVAFLIICLAVTFLMIGTGMMDCYRADKRRHSRRTVMRWTTSAR